MDKTKMRLAAFFDQDEDEDGGSSVLSVPVDSQKLNQFTQGTMRKSKREKEKEAAEAKRREEEERAAQAYADFVDEFEGEGSSRRKAGGSGFVRAGGEAAPAYSAPSGPSSDTTTRAKRMFEETIDTASVTPKPRGKRAMDTFLDEIKREQADREARYARHGHPQGKSATAMAAYEGQSGSRDRGDPETTNLFVANLPMNITETSFGQFFARIGPVNSIKIMWPRTDGTVGPGSDINASRRNKSAGLSGFVSYMTRRDAETALRELDGVTWGDSALRVGWSKAVPVGARPLYVVRKSSRSPDRHRTRHSRSRSPRRRSSSRDRHDRRRSRSHERDRYERRRSRSYDRRRSRSRSRRSRSRDAADEVSESFVRAVATQVRGNDATYEASLCEREKANSQYAFLADRKHRKYRYYRTLLERRDAVEAEFNDEGYNSVYSTDSAEESERERSRKHQLGSLARKRFQAMLRALSGKRGELARCMAFSLEHAEAASEVADIIITSLLVDGTPVPRKVSRLHLICDILHNSAVPLPGAWRFRQEFQSRLGIVFDHLSSIYHSFPGRITADTFKGQIVAVLILWEDSLVFPAEFISELRERLEGAPLKQESTIAPAEQADAPHDAPATVAPRFKASSFKPATEVAQAIPVAVVAPEEDSEGEPMDEGTDDEADATPATISAPIRDEVDGKLVNDDIDGVPLDDMDGEPVVDDLDGAPLDDIDGEPIDDIDGAPLDDVDGAPLDDDLDGEPMEDLDGTPVQM